ncbi:hypothetical protein VP01_13207g1, partial [Puccinia sorghi]
VLEHYTKEIKESGKFNAKEKKAIQKAREREILFFLLLPNAIPENKSATFTATAMMSTAQNTKNMSSRLSPSVQTYPTIFFVNLPPDFHNPKWFNNLQPNMRDLLADTNS